MRPKVHNIFRTGQPIILAPIEQHRYLKYWKNYDKKFLVKPEVEGGIFKIESLIENMPLKPNSGWKGLILPTFFLFLHKRGSWQYNRCGHNPPSHKLATSIIWFSDCYGVFEISTAFAESHLHHWEIIVGRTCVSINLHVHKRVLIVKTAEPFRIDALK